MTIARCRCAVTMVTSRCFPRALAVPEVEEVAVSAAVSAASKSLVMK